MERSKEFQTEKAELFPFDPLVVVQDVCKRWLLVVVLAVMVGVGAYILTDMSYTPTYRTSATLVVTTRGSATTVYSNLSSTTSLASVFSNILNSSVFRKTIMEEAGVSSFGGTISASAAADTNILTITVTDSNPGTAFAILQAVLNNHETITYQIIGDIVVEVLQAPTVPTNPSNSVDAVGRMRQMMLLTAAGVCVVLALFSFTRDAVRSDREARRKLNCHYLGQIPHERKYKTVRSFLAHRKTSILITNPVTSFRFVETIRKLRRRIEQRMKGGKVLMVTSLLENEGKSTVAANLAMVMAKKYGKVLLIDCDLRKPACNILLEQNWTGPGVREVLTGKAQVSEALTQDSSSGLWLLLEKKGGRDSGDLVASQEMRRMLDWARQEFDYVVLDLPPMSVVTDAEAVVDLVDGSLLVVRQNGALAPALNKAIATLNRGGAKMLGCVLNNVYSTQLFSGQGRTGYGFGNEKHGQYGRYGGYGAYGDSRPQE